MRRKRAFFLDDGQYEFPPLSGKVTGLIKLGNPCDEAASGDQCLLFVDRTPFYCEAGGQVGDRGVIQSEKEGSLFRVMDTQKIASRNDDKRTNRIN